MSEGGSGRSQLKFRSDGTVNHPEASSRRAHAGHTMGFFSSRILGFNFPCHALGCFLFTAFVLLLFALFAPQFGLQDIHKAFPQPLPIKEGSVAVCLAGGLRTFELTASSIIDHLLNAYPRTHVFVSAPLNENSHKILLLEGAADIRAIKIISQIPLSRSAGATALLRGRSSPNGLQGLLQYFELVEGCVGLIEEEEQRQQLLYEWVLRTRPDGLWSGPPPSLSGFDGGAYTYPEGSLWGGINDRLGMTHRSDSAAALARFSVLEELARSYHGPALNSETCLKQHLLSKGIPFVPLNFPFCVLSQRDYRWPLSRTGEPVLTLNTETAMNGARCWPCWPAVQGPRAWGIISQLERTAGAPFPVPANRTGKVGLCVARGGWGADWEALFDAQGGRSQSAMRAYYQRLDHSGCIARLTSLLLAVRMYDGPTVIVLCRLKEWARVLRVLTVDAPLLPSPGAYPNMSGNATYAGKALSPSTHILPHFPAFDTVRGLAEMWNRSISPSACSALVSFLKRTAPDEIRAEHSAFLRQTHFVIIKCGGKAQNQVCLFLSEKELC